MQDPLCVTILDPSSWLPTVLLDGSLNPPADAGGTRNQNIQSVLTGGYASVDVPGANQAIKTSLTSTAWEVTAVDTFSFNFRIKLPNTNLVWSVPSGSGIRTNITLTAQASGNTDMTQQWKLTNV